MQDARRIPGWVSRRDREPVTIAGTLVLPDGHTLPVTVRDLTPEGCKIECDETLPIGAKVVLNFAASTAAAHVRWSIGREAGLQIVD